MTKSLLYIFMLAVLIGCSAAEEETNLLPPVEPDYAVDIYADVALQAVETRAFTAKEKLVPEKDTLGMYALRSTVVDGEVQPVSWKTSPLFLGYKNSPYVVSAGYGHPLVSAEDQSATLFPGGANMALVYYSYYPYIEYVPNNTLTGAPSIPIEISADNRKQTDYLYAIKPVVANTRSFSLQYKHALSRLQILIHCLDETYTVRYCPKIYQIKVKTNKKQSGVMSFTTDSVTFVNSNSTGLSEFVYDYGTETPFLIYGAASSQIGEDFLFIPGTNVIDEISITGIDADGNLFDNVVIYSSEFHKPIDMSPNCVYTMTLDYTKRAGAEQNGEQGIDPWVDDHENDNEITIE